jgi:hypothetical protein
VRMIRLYSTALVLAVWAAMWWLGVRSDTLVGAALALLAVTAWIAENERRRQRRGMHR